MSGLSINSAFIQHSNSASIPIKEHMLLLDPQTKSTGIRGGEMTTFDIPTSTGANGSYIDMNSSYLELTVRAEGVADTLARLPVGGVNSLIQTVDVESSNFVVEHSDEWARMRQTLADINDEDEDRMGYKAFVEGHSHSLKVKTTDTTAKGVVSVDAITGPIRQGVDFSKVATGATESAPVRFCIPIPSQALNNGKHVPVHAISHLRYSITWVKPKNGIVAVAGTELPTGFTIDEPRLHLCYLEMSNKSREVINSKSGLSWSHPMWEVHKANTVASAASQSFRYPSHKSSVKTLMASFHDPAANDSNAQGVDFMSRSLNGLESFQYRINGEYFPQNEVRTTLGGAESMVELSRAFHKIRGKTGQISGENYTASDKTKAESTFVLATNCESNTGKSNSSFAGQNTLQEAPLLLCKFNSGNVKAEEVLLYVQYDASNKIGADGVWHTDQ